MNMPLYYECFDPQLFGVPYGTFNELLTDYFCIIDAYLHLAVVVREQEDTKKVIPLRGIPLPIQDVYQALYGSSLTGRAMQLSDEVKEDVIQMYKHLYSRCKHAEDRLYLLQRDFRLTHFEVFCLILALLPEYSRSHECLFLYLQNRTNEVLPTKGLAISLYQLLHELSQTEEQQLVFDTGCLGHFFLKTKENAQTMSDGLYMERQVVQYLLYQADTCPPDWGAEIWEMVKGESWEETGGKGAACIMAGVERIHAAGEQAVVHLAAKSISFGRSFILQWAKKHEYRVLSCALQALSHLEVHEVRDRIGKLKMCAYFNHAVFCLTDDGHTDEESGLNMAVICEAIEEQFSFSFLLTALGKGGEWNHFKRKICRQLSAPTAEESAAMWSRLCIGYPIKEHPDGMMRGSPPAGTQEEMQRVLDTARLHMLSEGKERIGETEIAQSMKQSQPVRLGPYASEVVSNFRWEDLILEDSQKDMLQLLCRQVQYRRVVGEQWGFYRKMPYGRGIHAMFYGAPGTGKTMAAGVAANELGMALYRIDLSQLMSKYIGETEKNIAALFDKARDLNAILFFDEADGLFTKRTDVRHSNDRSANAMTGYLLQKLEEYQGVSILATNLANHIDDAFKRRLKLMIHFAFPDETTRLKLFQSILPKEARCDEKLDFAFFAKQFELSGSGIREVLVNAAYIAAGEEKGICNRHVVQAVQMNYLKYGKTLKAQDFGYLMD